MSVARIIPADDQIARANEIIAIPRDRRTAAEQAELDNLETRAYQRHRRLPDRVARLRRELAEIEALLPAAERRSIAEPTGEAPAAQTLGAALATLRRLKGWSQAQASVALGFQRSSLNEYENDQKTPKLDRVRALATAYGDHSGYLEALYSGAGNVGIARLWADNTRLRHLLDNLDMRRAA